MLRTLAGFLIVLALAGATGCGRTEAESVGRESSGDGSRVTGDKSVHVDGYTRKDGTTVKSHDRAAPGQGGGRRR